MQIRCRASPSALRAGPPPAYIFVPPPRSHPNTPPVQPHPASPHPGTFASSTTGGSERATHQPALMLRQAVPPPARANAPAHSLRGPPGTRRTLLPPHTLPPIPPRASKPFCSCTPSFSRQRLIVSSLSQFPGVAAAVSPPLSLLRGTTTPSRRCTARNRAKRSAT